MSTTEEIVLTVIGWVATTGGAYWLGLRSQRSISKHEARVAALSVIDQVGDDIRDAHFTYMDQFVESKVHARLKDPIFNFSARVRFKSARDRIEFAWRDYQKIGYDEIRSATKDTVHQLLLKPLQRLRDEVSDA